MTNALTFFGVPLLLLLPALQCHCQDFEVASITPCSPGTSMPQWEHDRDPHFTSPGGRFTARAASLNFLIEWAYGLQPAQHTGGPAWLRTDRYNILAEAAGNSTDEQFKLMLRHLLADRFQLRAHQEHKQLPVLVLSVGKAPPRLHPAKDGEVHLIQLEPRTDPGQNARTLHIAATRFSLAQLCELFGRQLDRIILDRTGLDGEYDFTIDVTPDEGSHNVRDGFDFLAVLRQQLGFRVTSDKVPVDILVIDSIAKVAAGNE